VQDAELVEGEALRAALEGRLGEDLPRVAAELVEQVGLSGEAVAGARAWMSALPGVPQVACFDTAFHAT